MTDCAEACTISAHIGKTNSFYTCTYVTCLNVSMLWLCLSACLCCLFCKLALVAASVTALHMPVWLYMYTLKFADVMQEGASLTISLCRGGLAVTVTSVPDCLHHSHLLLQQLALHSFLTQTQRPLHLPRLFL